MSKRGYGCDNFDGFMLVNPNPIVFRTETRNTEHIYSSNFVVTLVFDII